MRIPRIFIAELIESASSKIVGKKRNITDNGMMILSLTFGIEINQGSEVSNVCKGMQDLIADGKVETKIETRAEMIVGTVDHMVCVGNMSVTDACKLAGFSEEEYYSSKRMLTRKR